MCSLLTLWEVGHVFLCACIMLTCHFHPFCCLPLNTVQSMFYAAILFWLASNSIYAYCGAWKFVNPLQFFVLLTNKSMRKKSKKNFSKKKENSIKPNETKSITLHLFEDDWQKNMNMFSVSFGTSFITNECENWS